MDALEAVKETKALEAEVEALSLQYKEQLLRYELLFDDLRLRGSDPRETECFTPQTLKQVIVSAGEEFKSRQKLDLEEKGSALRSSEEFKDLMDDHLYLTINKGRDLAE